MTDAKRAAAPGDTRRQERRSGHDNGEGGAGAMTATTMAYESGHDTKIGKLSPGKPG